MSRRFKRTLYVGFDEAGCGGWLGTLVAVVVVLTKEKIVELEKQEWLEKYISFNKITKGYSNYCGFFLQNMRSFGIWGGLFCLENQQR